jgi:hypothetical protein
MKIISLIDAKANLKIILVFQKIMNLKKMSTSFHLSGSLLNVPCGAMKIVRSLFAPLFT